MNNRASHLVQFQFGTENLSLYLPDGDSIKKEYEAQRLSNPDIPFPYWSKVWPSAIALCEFLSANRELIRNKKVTEIGAGLALPSLFAARYASGVMATDYIPEAVNFMQLSMEWNGIMNMQCALFDWSSDTLYPETEVLLVSDINYDPDQFEQILLQIHRFLKTEGLIILATPQRRMSVPFMKALEPFKKQESVHMIHENGQTIPVSIWVL